MAENYLGFAFFISFIGGFYLTKGLKCTKPESAVISELWVYPVKSCAGYKVSSSLIVDTGLQYDRLFAIVDKNTDRVATQRTEPKMALIKARISDNSLVLQFSSSGKCKSLVVSLDNAGPLVKATVWGNAVEAFDMGDGAAEWIDSVLDAGGKYRLVRMNQDYVRSTGPADDGRGKSQLSSIDKNGRTLLADDRPFLLASEESLSKLASLIPEENLPDRNASEGLGSGKVLMSRFRPNIIVKNASAFAEDYWRKISVVGKSCSLEMVGYPCSRCKLPENNPETGEYDANNKQPITKLKEMHKGDSIGYKEGKHVKEVG